MKNLNEVYSSRAMRRRYEVWFIRLGLADASGAWWFRYLLMNLGRGGCSSEARGMPVQVWATWFPREGKPQTFIEGFPLPVVELSARGLGSFRLRAGENAIDENSCRGNLAVDGHAISWNLRYVSSFSVTMSEMGWIGFSRTPHSDALISGEINFDGRRFASEPLGFGVQGHNCGYRHRKLWSWAHANFARPGEPSSCLEALVYEMPFGLLFRKAVLWHKGERHAFRNLQEVNRDRKEFQWEFGCSARDGLELEVAFDGRGSSMHSLPYVKTDCAGTFEVRNNSLAKATLCMKRLSGSTEQLETSTGAVLEMAGG